MTVEKMKQMIGADKSDPNTSKLFGSFLMPLLLIFTDDYGLVDIEDNTENEYRIITLKLAHLDDDDTVIYKNSDLVMENLRKLFGKYYEKPIDEVLNGPLEALLGFHRSIIAETKINFIIGSEEEVNCMINNFDKDKNECSNMLITGTFNVSTLSISIPNNKLKEVVCLTNERLYEYASFILYNWLVLDTDIHNWDNFHAKLKVIETSVLQNEEIAGKTSQ